MERIVQTRADETRDKRVVFSALYNESDGFLATYVENFLRHTDANALLLVNLPPGRRIACPIAEASARVLVFSGEMPRRKYGHTLLNGHLEAFDTALAQGGHFDYFCPLASNSLFVRRFDLVATLAALERSDNVADVELDDLPDRWWWSTVRKSPDLLGSLKTDWGLTVVASSQIEGFFAAAADWGLLHQRRAQIIALGERMVPEYTLPFEEIFPATVICTSGSRRYVFLCHVFWDRMIDDNVRLDDMLNVADRFPAHLCILKWFQRSPIDLVTAAAATGLVAGVATRLDATPAADRGQQRVLHRMMFEDLARTLRAGEGFVPLMSTWRSAAGPGQSPPLGRFDFEQTLDIDPRRILLPLQPDAPAGYPAHFMTERTGVRLDLKFSLIDGDQSVITLSSTLAVAGDHDETVLQGILFLACCMGGGNRIFRVRVLSDTADFPFWLTDRIVLARDGQLGYRKSMPIVEHDGMREYYYTSEALPDQGDAWIGLPVFGRSDFSVAIDAI